MLVAPADPYAVLFRERSSASSAERSSSGRHHACVARHRLGRRLREIARAAISHVTSMLYRDYLRNSASIQAEPMKLILRLSGRDGYETRTAAAASGARANSGDLQSVALSSATGSETVMLTRAIEVFCKAT